MTTTPKHYKPMGGVDPTAVVDDIGFWARLAFKYIWRAQMKDGIRDIDKALDTLERIYKAEPGWFLPRTRKTNIGVKGNQDLHRCAYPSAFSPLARDRALTFYARVMLGETRIIERRAGRVLGVTTPERLNKYIYVTLQELLKSYRLEILVLEEAKNMKGFALDV